MLVSELVTRALNRGALPGVDVPAARDINNGVDRLNEMLSAWALEGLDLNQPVLAAGDTLYVDTAFHKAIIDNLAVELAVDHGALGEMSPTVIGSVQASKDLVRTALYSPTELAVDRALLPRRGWFNFSNG